MPRRPRVATGGYVYHVLNRAVGRSTIFETRDDYAAFEWVLEEAGRRVEMRLLAFCRLCQPGSDGSRVAGPASQRMQWAAPSARPCGAKSPRNAWAWNRAFGSPAILAR